MQQNLARVYSIWFIVEWVVSWTQPKRTNPEDQLLTEHSCEYSIRMDGFCVWWGLPRERHILQACINGWHPATPAPESKQRRSVLMAPSSPWLSSPLLSYKTPLDQSPTPPNSSQPSFHASCTVNTVEHILIYWFNSALLIISSSQDGHSAITKAINLGLVVVKMYAYCAGGHWCDH